MTNNTKKKLVPAMNDSSKKLKKNKLPSYLAIGAVAAGSTLGAFNEANAGNTIKTTTAIISEANISDAQANDIVIAPTDITASVQTLAFNVATVSDIIMGINDSTVQTVTLNVAPAAAAVTIAANIVAVGDSDNDVTKLIVSSSVANSSQLVTFNGKIGPGVITGDGALADTNDENDIDSIEVGSATTAAQALFNEHTVTDLLTVFGGNQSNENNVATFAKVLNSTAGIVLNDSGTAQTAKIVFSSSATADILGSINGGAADEGIMQITGANKTFDGAIGDTQKIGLIDIDESTNMNAAVIATAVTVADGKTAQFDVALTTTTIDLANTGILKTIGTSTIAGNVTGGTINSSTAVQTYSGTIGTALKKTNINADFGTIFNGVVNATTISVADGKTVDFDLSVTADTITLGSSTSGSSVSFTGGTLKTVTGDLVSFNTDEKGTVISNGTADVIFAGNLGTAARSLLLLTATDDTTTNQDVFVKGLTNANGKDLNMKGNVEIGTNDAVLTGTTSDLLLSGTVAQTITATAAGSVIKGAGNGQGIVKVSNAAGATLDIVLGTGARLLNLTTSGTGHVILNKTGNLVDKLTWGATSVVEISTSMVQDATIFTTNAIGNGIAVGATIVMPSDLAADSTITLITNVGATTNVDNTVTRVNAAVKDTALVDYVATKTGTQVVNVTANEKSAAAIATSLGASKNEATAFRQVRNAMVGSGSVTDLSTINGVLNERDGFTISDDTLLAKQAAPQTDSIGGSSIATRAMTGTVQGIVSNRMASLRSGDAFVTGMSAGNGMSANSGFIQAFGSEGEQKNTSAAGATVFGFDTETSGLALGVDGITDSGSTIGLSASYSTTDVVGKGSGKSKNAIDSYTVSAYADKSTENGYIEGSLTYGINDNTATRLVNVAGLNRAYSANYDSQQFSLKVGGGVPQEVIDGTFITPFVSATATNINTDSYIEKSTVVGDALRLKVEQDEINSLVGTVGVKAHVVTDHGTPMISLAVNNEFGDGQISSQNTYQGGGTKFKTTTDVEELSATLGLGFSFGNDVTSLNLNYEANVNDDEYVNQYGSVKIVAKF